GVEGIVYARVMAWTGLLFDFTIGFLLLIPRSRLLALALLAIFHGINQLTLPIGVFPFLAFTASFIFLEPDWPLQLGKWLKKPCFVRPDRCWLIGGAILVPGLGLLLGWKLPGSVGGSGKQFPSSLSNSAFAFVIFWLTSQALIPLRHYFIAGAPNWTEEAQGFSWRMMLRQKAAGSLTFHLDDASIYDPGSRGRRVDWSRVPDAESRAVFVPIDAHAFIWKENHGLNTFYEGLAGFRLIQIVKANSGPELIAERDALESWWMEQTGEVPRIRETRSLAACLDAASERLRILVKDDSAGEVHAHVKLLEAARNQLRVMGDVELNLRGRYVTGVHDCLYTVLESGHGELLREELTLAHPFALLGIEPPDGQRFWVIEQRESAGEMQTLSESLGRAENSLIWCDFSRLRYYEWSGLPEWIPVFESGRLPLLWNYFRELNRHQIEQLAVRPFLIWQYARRIADDWETRYGHRPSVHCYGSVMMNYRYPRSLIDPQTDLASVTYRFWSHNPWILPLESDRIGITDRLRKADSKLEKNP
ncbi:MAG: HTTM domain-containing protein, partial [Verrucomicrobiales bacterium]